MRVASVAVWAAAALAACGGGDRGGVVEPVQSQAAGPSVTGAPAVAAIELARAGATLTAGSVATVDVTLRDRAAHVLAGRGVAWTSSDTTVARVDAATTAATLVVRAVAVGVATLTATSEGQTARLTVTVAQLPVRGLQVDTTPRMLVVGDTLVVTALPLDSAGRPLPGRAVTFATPSTALSVTPLGAAPGGTLAARVLATTAGAGTIEIGAEGVRATIPVTAVVRATPAAALAFGPRALALGAGRTVDVPAILTGAAGDTLTGHTVIYATGNPAVATIGATGHVTTVGPGTTTLTAAVDGRTATLPVTVLAPVGPHSFHIDLRFVGTPDPTLAAAARQAALRWEAVITASPGAFPVSLAPGACGTGTPAVDESVENLVIFVRLDSIDGPGGPNGNVLGTAGPCVLRQVDRTFGTPVVGIVNLDAYDLLHAGTAVTTLDLLTHEIGHVLGIGVTWNIAGQRELVPDQASGHYDYVGPGAMQAAYDLGFAAGVGAPVPVEDRGGGGTVGSHWRERVFLSELMTGYIDAVPNPLSQVTVGTLADLGWLTDPAGADPYTVTTARGGVAAAAPSGASRARLVAGRGTDRPLAPRFALTRGGRLTRLAP